MTAKPKVVGVVFSARKKGNCLDCVEYCLKKLEKSGFSIEIVNAFDHKITPCSHCEYECFADVLKGKEELCPIRDDVPRIYEKCKSADILLFAIPTYGGHLASIYRAFTERALTQFNQFKEYRQLLHKVSFIIIGNLSSGGEAALYEALSDYYIIKPRPEAILLSSREYGSLSVKGDLIQVKEVREKLDRHINLLKKKFER